MTWRELFRRAGWVDGMGMVGVVLVTAIALLALWITPYDPLLRVAPAYQPPSPQHWFGTDEIGRDLLSRVLLGVQITWLPALGVIGCSLVVGSAIGLVTGLIGGWVDMAVQRIVDLFLVMPSTLLALAVVAVLGPGIFNTMVALAIFWWAWYARLAQDETRRLIARSHFQAAQVSGVSQPRLLLRYLFPGVAPSLAVAATLDITNVILAVSLMSFLRLGQPPPAAELGAMTARALESLTVHWWLPVLPAVTIFVICLLANLAGDGLRSALRGA